MTAPTVVSGATTFHETSSGTNHTISRPASYSEGDLGFFLACIDCFEGGDGTQLTKPSEFGTEHYANQGVNGDTAIAVGSLWMLTAGASEPSTYTATSNNSERVSGLMFFVNGHNGVDVKSASANTGSGTTVTFPSVTTTVNDCLILRILIFDVSATGQIPVNLGTGYTLIAEDEYTSAGGVHVQYITQASAGATGTLAVNMGQSEQWAAWTVAIAPETGYTLPALQGSFSLTGYAADLIKAAARSMIAETGYFTTWLPPFTPVYGSLIPQIAPIEYESISRVLIANHFGQIIADTKALIQPVSWRLNTFGKTLITFARTDPQAIEENLRFNNRILIQFSNGLPDWAGVFIGPRGWSESTIQMEAHSAEHILSFYRTDRGRYFKNAPAGYIFRSVVNEANAAFQTGVEAGEVFMGGALHSPAYHLEDIYSIVKDSVCGRLSNYEFNVTAQLDRGRIRLFANLFEKMGSRKPGVWLLEGASVAVESFEEQGPVINHWLVAGADISGATADGWGEGRLIAEQVDNESLGLYGRVMDAEVYGGVENFSEVDEAARFLVKQTARPRNVVCVTASNFEPARFRDYGLGDTLRTILPNYGFSGIDGFFRVIGREFESDKGVCGLVLEEDYG